ncbi:MAG TPA: hypothetical protein VGI40_17480 [Pirellulaceae bacterium]
MSTCDQPALERFRDYLIQPGEMLCFDGPTLDEHVESLRQLTADGLVTKEKFKGGYTLTQAGFDAMHADDSN